MRFIRVVVFPVLAFLISMSCNRDPRVVALKFVETGNKYFDKGRYTEARIYYRRALQKDRKCGPAYYKEGLTESKLQQYGQDVTQFRRPIELLPADQPDRWDSMVKLCDLYMAGGHDQKELMDEVERYSTDMLKRDPNSFDGHRLTADLALS